MANNYTQFSIGIEDDLEILQAIVAEFERRTEDEDNWDDLSEYMGGIDWSIEDLEGRHGRPWLWIHDSAGEAFLDGMIAALAKVQRETGARGPWSGTFAVTCSKPRIDEFDGGAFIVFNGEIESINGFSWAQDRLVELGVLPGVPDLNEDV